jgi:hypothetical protein
LLKLDLIGLEDAIARLSVILVVADHKNSFPLAFKPGEAG